MPKVKERSSAKLNRIVAEYKEIFKTDGAILFCKVCNRGINFTTKFQIDQHLNGAKHKELFDRRNVQSSENLLLSETNKTNVFFKDLCKAFIGADIPLDKLNNTELKEFLKKYTNQIIPSESTLRKNYVNILYDSMLNEIKARLKNHYLWISIDETTDIAGRFVASVIVGIMHPDEKLSKTKFLLNLVELEKTNHGEIARIFDDSLKLLGNDFDRKKVLLYLTDAAPYMVKSGRGLKLFYDKLLHVTCIAHGLHRVAETIRHLFRDVDELISNGKKIFLKAPSRVEEFKEHFPEISLPPEPIITRWGTWIDAVNYYAKNFSEFKSVVNNFDENEALSIKKTKDVLKSASLVPHLTFISANYGFLSETIMKLEGQLSLKQQIDLIEDAIKKIGDLDGEYASQIKTKLDVVLEKNEGFKI